MKDVFAIDSVDNVFVNESLPSITYHLRLQTKARAKAASFKYAWAKSGRIIVWRGDGHPIIEINTSNDLSKLNWLIDVNPIIETSAGKGWMLAPL